MLGFIVLLNKIFKMSSKEVEKYISQFPDEVQEILQKIRKTIREEAPDAEEIINYQIPTFKLNGNLVHFAAFKKHIGFYPTPSGIENSRDELKEFETAKGSVKFPLNRPIPYSLISKITRFRVKEQLDKKL